MLGRVIGLAAAAAAMLPATAAAAASCTLKPSSWVAGSVDLCDGALLYRLCR